MECLQRQVFLIWSRLKRLSYARRDWIPTLGNVSSIGIYHTMIYDICLQHVYIVYIHVETSLPPALAPQATCSQPWNVRGSIHDSSHHHPHQRHCILPIQPSTCPLPRLHYVLYVCRELPMGDIQKLVSIYQCKSFIMHFMQEEPVLMSQHVLTHQNTAWACTTCQSTPTRVLALIGQDMHIRNGRRRNPPPRLSIIPISRYSIYKVVGI